MVQSAIRGLLDNERFSYEADDLKLIDLLAVGLDVDIVTAFIDGTNILEEFDRSAAQLKLMSFQTDPPA